MDNLTLSRRSLLKTAGASAALLPGAAAQAPGGAEQAGPTTSTAEDRDRRMQWWHEARFGMFIHFGLYSVSGPA